MSLDRSGAYILHQYGIDTVTGFFPSAQLDPLPAPFICWEKALLDARKFVSLGDDITPQAVQQRSASQAWREKIRSLGVLTTDYLEQDSRLLQRAHHVLAYLVQYYVHSAPPEIGRANILVPASLSIPLVKVSQKLGIAPVLTFADTVLWNVYLVDRNAGFQISNMRCLHLFSGLPDEEAFYLTSAAIELRGIEVLRLIGELFTIPPKQDSTQKCKALLQAIRRTTDELTQILQGVRETCHPRVFYNAIRPWFRGSPQDGSGPPWIYEGVDPLEARDLSGPSAGQSSVMHTLDALLDIDHTLSEERHPEPSRMNKGADTQFMQRMWKYMPGKHREFLKSVKAKGNLRSVVKARPELASDYNEAVQSLKRFRDAHIRIAVLYIISMARSPDQNNVQEAAGPARQVRGTGGSDLTTLLKSGRDATTRAILKPN